MSTVALMLLIYIKDKQDRREKISTMQQLIEIQNALVLYEIEEKKEIVSLSELPSNYYQFPDDNVSFTDGWGNQILYQKDEVTDLRMLFSSGYDGKAYTDDDITIIIK